MADKGTLARNLLLLNALGVVCAAASEAGLKLVLLKGAALLAKGVYGPGERGMTDLDLLIRPEDEKAFDAMLTGLGFKPMENSSQAYYKITAPAAPPVIVDLHTGLWHEKDTGALWRRAEYAGPGMELPPGRRQPADKSLCGENAAAEVRPRAAQNRAKAGPVRNAPPKTERRQSPGGNTAAETIEVAVLGLEDQLLHLASHTLLYHGCLATRTLQDIGRLLEFVYGKAERGDFWRKAAAIAEDGKLKPVLYPVLSIKGGKLFGLMSAEELSAFEPRGADKLKNHFFEKAAVKHTRLLEYLLPVLYRPSLFARYLFPGRIFLKKRYGKNSWTNHIRRPFQLITAILKKED